MATSLLEKLFAIPAFQHPTTDTPSLAQAFYDFLVDLRPIWKRRTLNALPTTHAEALTVMQAGDIGVIHQPNATRSIEWLQTQGKCIDHIQAGQSTLANAGHGAFARRFLPQGTVITGSPLHHVFRSFFDMYDFNPGQQRHRDSPHRGYQLLLNYCYGDNESTLLLCPYGPSVNYINHNQSLTNVEVRWAAHGTTAHNSSWLNLSPNEMMGNTKVSLGFDFVATRDIPEGTELFLDYGDTWEAAWLAHAQQWAAPRHEWLNYTSAAQMNKVLADDQLLRTQEEQQQDPYPSNLELRCHSDLPNTVGLKWPMDEYGIPCRIRKRWHDEKTNRMVYDVEWTDELEEDDEEDGPDKLEHKTRIDTTRGVPREGIKFFDLPYTTDLHLKEAFRHEIAIPEHMVPAQWKDLALGSPLHTTSVEL